MNNKKLDQRSNGTVGRQKQLVRVDLLGLQAMDAEGRHGMLRIGAPCMQAAVSLAYQGVIVLNLLHCRLSCQGELDDLEVVQLLRGRSTVSNKPNLTASPPAHVVHTHRGHAKLPGDFLKYRLAKCFTSNHFTAAQNQQ